MIGVVFRTVILSAAVHTVCKEIRKTAQEFRVDSAVQIFGGIFARHAVVRNHLLLDIPRWVTACKKIHCRLHRDLCAFHVTCEERFLQRHNGRRLRIRIKVGAVRVQCFHDFFAGGNHPIRGHVPVRTAVRRIQRQRYALDLTAL